MDKSDWAQAYPELRATGDHLAAAARLGYEGGQSWVLPESDWWTEYLGPLEARMELLRPEAAADPDLAALIADSRRAIDLYRRYPASVGYVFHLVHKPSAN